MPEILRTPDDRFENLPGYPFAPHYVDVDGVRMHYIDEGEGGETILCMHGEPSWSYLYRHMIPLLVQAGHRVIAPDLVGFGRSDKLAHMDDYTFEMHASMVNGLIKALDLRDITIVVQDWGGLLGLNAVAEMPDRFARLVIMNTGLPTGEEPMPRAFKAWQLASQRMTDMPVGDIVNQGTETLLASEVVAAYDAPFPNAAYKMGARVFPSLVPTSPDMAGASNMQYARQVLSQWQKPALVMFSDKDPITHGGDRWFRALIPTAKDQPAITIEGAGHFLQEDKGPEIAQQVIDFIERTVS